MDRGPRSEGDKTFGLIFLGIAGLVVVAVLYYIFFTGDEPHRWDIACALVGGTVREDYPIVRARTGDAGVPLTGRIDRGALTGRPASARNKYRTRASGCGFWRR